MASWNSMSICMLNAFSASGRLNVSVATPLSMSMRTVSYVCGHAGPPGRLLSAVYIRPSVPTVRGCRSSRTGQRRVLAAAALLATARRRCRRQGRRRRTPRRRPSPEDATAVPGRPAAHRCAVRRPGPSGGPSIAPRRPVASTSDRRTDAPDGPVVSGPVRQARERHAGPRRRPRRRQPQRRRAVRRRRAPERRHATRSTRSSKAVNATGGLAGRPIVAGVSTRPIRSTGRGTRRTSRRARRSPGTRRSSIVVANVLSPSPVLMECLGEAAHPARLGAARHADHERGGRAFARPTLPAVDAERGAARCRRGRAGERRILQGREGRHHPVRRRGRRSSSPRRCSVRDSRRIRVCVVAECKMPRPVARERRGDGVGCRRATPSCSSATKGVTHVLFVPSGGVIPLLFMTAAASQGFSPKYGISAGRARASCPRTSTSAARGRRWPSAGPPSWTVTTRRKRSAANARCQQGAGHRGPGVGQQPRAVLRRLLLPAGGARRTRPR